MTKQLMAIITKHLIVVGEQRKTLSGIGESLIDDLIGDLSSHLLWYSTFFRCLKYHVERTVNHVEYNI